MVIQVVSDDEAMRLADTGGMRVALRDLALGQILQTLAAFGVNVKLSGLGVAVFDHGAAPPGLSDRIFRFNFLRERLDLGLGLNGFAFVRDDVPPSMTRLRAVATTAPADLPLLLMDTAPPPPLAPFHDPPAK